MNHDGSVQEQSVPILAECLMGRSGRCVGLSDRRSGAGRFNDWRNAAVLGCMLKWLSINKDAMIALVVLVSPLIAILGGLVSSVVSYRAVVTDPRIQREIADRQFRLTSSRSWMRAGNFGHWPNRALIPQRAPDG